MIPSASATPDEILASLAALRLPEHFESSARWVAADYLDLTVHWGPGALLRWLEQRCDFSTAMVWKRSHGMREPVRLGSFREAAAAWAENLSLQVNNFHQQLAPDDPLRRLLAAVERSVRMPFEASNLFLTPAGGKATPTHLDDFDLFTVQIFGRKEWRIWNTNLLRDCVEASPDERVSLSAGSLFYLPACQPHSVVAATETSVSLGCAFQRRMFKQLLERLCRHPEIVQHVDKNLPPLTAGNDLVAGWEALTTALAGIDKMKILRAAMAVRQPTPPPRAR